MNYEEKYMYRCLQLAAYGAGYVAPNPMVGAVVVHNDRIIGEGFHQRFGESHAEPNAIHAVKDESLLTESTLYVNLEPCSHFGKTPPCANLIVEKGIPRVVVGTLDPNPKVSGKGIEILKNAGVEVVTGILEDTCYQLNKRFFTWQKEKRPYVLLKWAQTRDGFIDRIRENATTPPLQISDNMTKQLTHRVRSENQAIMVSTNTVVLDNPSLTVRNWSGKNPIRIVLDRTGRIPRDYKIFDQTVKTLVFTENPHESTEKVIYIHLQFDENMLGNMLKIIASQGIHSVLVEGGSMLLNSFIKSGLWDEARTEVSDILTGNGVPAPSTEVAAECSTNINNHLYLIYKNRNKKFFYE
ncbi:MAG: bifunctional diaminohydroxyphosphoribosylaminopyrimidine deaminase/5-amino-6-(5-phosphoribosylamino)uracil reductase RibD [Paludibacter sp.]|nr:bifunctional diaminohydroxyphosphoribosylaminopyrimidine deaminase/5-amino-6-(5-phosphoribosylamino)uracil reductase RibD [Paludibacter sp.]MDD4428709.1 bifunctional diaminohydroxyphosphoribosylaminopyrimidine deaminase/5-amino-6-(5-phosphoribosylamino)uracil reductase RibD [Paludibacter sp.]